MLNKQLYIQNMILPSKNCRESNTDLVRILLRDVFSLTPSTGSQRDLLALTKL